jgi:PEP-CTERM motif-containing protein
MKANLCWGRLTSIGLSLMVGVALAVSAKAQTVLVDFGTNLSFRGASSPNPDPNGHYWNNYFPGVFFTDFKDINNVPTTIDFGPDATGVGTDSYNGPAGATDVPPTSSHVVDTDIDAAALGNLGVKEAAFDYAASPGPDVPGNTAANLTRFQIQSLDISKTYTLTLFGSHKYSADATTVYSVFNDAAYTSQIGTAALNVHDLADASLHNRNTVATISGLVPDASGILYLQFVGLTGAQGYLNSMQITAVPEPSTLILLAGSGLALCFRRRGR